MIEQLRIRDLGVIADATLALGPGFTAITGETGAGKTMVVTALGLLMGERSDAGAVRSGADSARVGGLIRTEDPQIKHLVQDLGGEVEEGDLTLTRTVSSEGRSRASVGGSAAPVGSLAKLADRLFTVHGQSEQLRLRSTVAQREMLDRFGGRNLLELLAEYQVAHEERRDLETTLAELRETRDERTREAAQLREQIGQIEAAEPQPGEELELKQRIERLSNLEELRSATSTALQAVANDGDDPFASDVTGLIERALREIERVAAMDSQLGPMAESLRSLSFQVSDVGRELSSYASNLDQDGPGELSAANDRLAQLTTLMRLYGADIAAVIAYGEASAARLGELDGDDERIDLLSARLAETRERERELSTALTAVRTEAAEKLSRLVTVELRELALPDAEFVALVEQAELGRFGADEIKLLLQPHPGASPRPLAKGASGGELSRVMLAIEVVVAASDPVPTFVFDEVDAGVGGAAAIEIGRRLARLAHTSQVIVVTHLAQVAAFANNHLQVVKDSAGGFTQSSCRQLEGEDRLAEMARLLSGLSDSESALAHAGELLSLANE